MSRQLSQAFRRSSNGLSTNEAFLTLLTIRHPPTKSIFRVVDNGENVVSRGQTFTAFPFTLTLPAESGEEIGIATLTIDNIDLVLIDMLREATTAPTVDIEVVLSSAPDVVEISILSLALREVSWDANTVTGRLYNEDFLSQAFPGDAYNPAEWQGIFG